MGMSDPAEKKDASTQARSAGIVSVAILCSRLLGLVRDQLLNGLFGRKSGSVEGYNYSEANKHSGIVWDEATFREYIKNPKAKIPNTKMVFAGLNDEQDIELGKIKTRVIHTPGHTPGSLCFSLATDKSVLLAGDTLFRRSIGRTDLWGGSYEQIIESISDRLFRLDDSTVVVPGHGTETTIWEEKRENPFF